MMQGKPMWCARDHEFTATEEDARNGTDTCPECGLHGHFNRADAMQEGEEILTSRQPTFKDHEGRELRVEGVTALDAVGEDRSIQVSLTDEGIIADVYDEQGNVTATFGMMYEEFADFIARRG